MKVLILLAYYNPENAASIYLFENFIQELINRGNFVELIVPIPGRGISKEVHNLYKNRLSDYEKNNQLHIRRYKMYMEGKGTVSRFVRYLFCCIKHLYWGIKTKDVDIIFSESTPPILGMFAVFLKKIKKIPLIYNLQDIFPDSLIATGLSSKNSIAWRIGRLIENFTYNNADRIITISEDFRKNILAKGVHDEKINVVYNWVDQNAVVNIKREDNKLFDKYNLDRDKFYVTYSGNIGLSQNIELLVDVAIELSEIPDIQIVLVGDGAYLEQLKLSIKEKQIKNITLIPFQPYEDISCVFSMGDVGIVISKPGTGMGCVPSKTWSIMSASRPVLANFDESELEEILEGTIVSDGLKASDGPCGIFTKSGDKDSFKNALLFLYSNRDKCDEYGKNGRHFIMNNLTKEKGAGRYAEIVKELEANGNSL